MQWLHLLYLSPFLFALARELKMEKEERRFLPLNLKIETRESDDGPAKIVGYAAVFNSMSEDLGGFREKIAPGAFKGALKDSDTRALFNHDSNLVLGRASAGTLRMKEDDTGLHVEIDPPDTSFARDLMVSIERGDITQQSFGFTIKEDEWEDLDGDNPVRTLTKIGRLFDVSPVTFPAYPDTEVAVRSLKQARQDKKIETTPPFTLVSVSTLEEKSGAKIKVEVDGVEFTERKKTETPLAVSPLPAETKTVADPPENPEISNPEVNDLSFWRNAKAERIKKENKK